MPMLYRQNRQTRAYGTRNYGYYPRKNYRGGFFRRYVSRKIVKYGTGPSAPRFFAIRTTQSVSTNGAGVIAPVITTDPTGYQDWSNIAGLFENYRVCAVKIVWIPAQANEIATYDPIYVVGDSDDTTALASTNAAIQYTNCKVFSGQTQWKYYWKFPKVAATNTGGTFVLQGGFIETAAPVATGSIKLYGENLPASQLIGNIMVTAYVMARNRN